MKNTEKYTLKKAIFLLEDDFKQLVSEASGGKFTAEIDEDYRTIDIRITNNETETIGYQTDGEESNEYCALLKMLSQHFDTKVTSIHLDNFDTTGIWIVYA